MESAAVKRTLDELFPYDDLAFWNDAFHRTQAEVVLYDATLARVEARAGR